jgi:hypothetical protein
MEDLRVSILDDNIKTDIRKTRCEAGLIGSDWSPPADFCEHDNEPLGSIKAENFELMCYLYVRLLAYSV